MKNLGLLLLLILALGLALSAQAGVTTYTYYYAQPQVQVIEGQTTVTVEGAHTWGRVGQPLLPMGPVQLLLPPGEEAVSISAEAAPAVVLGDGYRIPHRNQPYPLSLGSAAKATPPDQAIYGSDDLFPQELAGDLQTQFYAGHGVVYAATHPVTYRPLKGELAYHPWIRVTITSRATAKAQDSFNSLLRVSRKTNERLAGIVHNPQTLTVYGVEQPTRPIGWDMLLITYQAAEPFYLDFANSKTRSGIMTKIVTTEYIYANYPGADNQTKIRNCIIDYYHNQGIAYVFLGGDNEQIPHRGLYCAAGYTDNDIAADLYYAALDGNWNADGDANWGEPGEEDFMAEVYIGRSCGDTQQEIANFLNKTNMYETAPVGNQIQSGLMAGEDLGWTIWAWSYKEEIRTGSSNYGYTTAGFPATFVVDTLYERPGYSWTAMGQLLPKLNAGPNLVNHLGHGNTDFVMKFYTSNITDANFTNNGINRNFFIAYSQACYSGSFDNRGTGGQIGPDCICEEFTTIAHAAVAWECNSRYGWGDLTTTNGPSQHFDRQFFDALFREGLTTLGKMNDDSKEDCIWMVPSDNTIRWCYYELNLLGDPTLDVWTSTPQAFNPVFNSVVLLGSSTFQVSGLANGALATISLNNTVLGQGTANASGIATVQFDAPLTQLGSLTLMVTQHNYLPYQGTVQSIPPSGPYVVYSSSVISDTLTGNGNGQLDYSETAGLTMRVQNVGVATANNINLTIRTTDAFITIGDSTAFIASLPANGYFTLPSGFQIHALPTAPDQHSCAFTLICHSDTATWTSYFTVLTHAPNAQYVSNVINDPPPGNQNHNLDPGETANIDVTIRNEGSVIVNGLQMTLSTTDPYVGITLNIVNLGPVAPNALATGNFGINALPSCPQEHVALLEIGFTGANGYVDSDTFSITVGDLTYDPTGPDAYGYRAYDPYDAPELPVYQWVEISPDSGGAGTQVPFTLDDQVFAYQMPFSFRYYGSTFDSCTIATNGWVGMGVQTAEDYSNSAIPNSDGPSAMIAAYWEDLSPQRANSGKVWRWSDPVNHRFIVEYNHIEQYAPVGNFETFQVIFYDPAFYPTSTGDGRIKVQYKEMSASVQTEGTIGIENPAETIGIQYLFDGALEVHAHPIVNHFAIMYTTPAGMPQVDITLTPINPPLVIPAAGGSFQFTAQLVNTGASPATFNAWIMQYTPQGQWQGPMLGPLNLTLPGNVTVTRTRTQNVPGTAAPGVYTYRGYVGVYSTIKWDSSSFQYTKSATSDGGPGFDNWANWGESFAPYENLPTALLNQPATYSLAECHPNPFNPATMIGYGLPQAGQVTLKVYDVSGRTVATLVDGFKPAGAHEVSFNGSKLSSGLYFYRLQAGDFSAVRKMMLVK